ncbi:MAG: threonylcarbamoyl-AMP synthase [Prevotellaceae bacterium]|jgi:L-threonylcarbamoyladenylate synthase|nr:threonylcarbamoyl-AMP synthase [Prevotellaceae bacterium]
MTEVVQQSLQVLRNGGLLLYPTDTLWGVGCDATNEKAVEKVYALKQRADNKSLILLVSEMDMVSRYVSQVPAIAYNLTEVADAPLTLIYPQARGLAANVPAADGSVALRIVQHDFCRQLLRLFCRPLVSTSANLSGQLPPAFFAQVPDEIKNGCDFIVPAAYEGAPTRKPSPIIKLGLHDEVEVIRKGGEG